MQTAKFSRQLSKFTDLRCCLLVGGQGMEQQFEAGQKERDHILNAIHFASERRDHYINVIHLFWGGGKFNVDANMYGDFEGFQLE